MTLLDTAKNTPTAVRKSRGDYDEAQLQELALAWLAGTVTYTQACNALYGKPSKGQTFYGIVANALRRAHVDGRIVIK